MKDAYIRQFLLTQRIQWTREQTELLNQARSSEVFEEADEFYRKAAVLGMRLDSIGEVVREIDKPNCSDVTRARAFQHHMRNMARLKYRQRPVGVSVDAIDQEVISQFYKDGVVVNNPKGSSAFADLV